MTAKRDTQNMDAARPSVEDLAKLKAKEEEAEIAKQAEAEKPDELDGAQKRPRCPKCGSPRYKVVSSPALVQYVKCEYCGYGFKLVK